MKSWIKYTFFAVCASAISVYVMSGLLYRAQIPQKLLKSILEKEFSKAFRREVTIAHLSGNLFSQTVLKNIKIANHDQIASGIIFKIDKLTANYSLQKALQKRGDIVAAIYQIDIDNVFFHLIRNKQDQWNFLELLTPPKNAPTPPPLTFRGKINVTNLFGQFTDEKGWEKDPFQTPFETTFDHGNASIDFYVFEKTKIHLSARLNDSNTKLVCSGISNSKNGQYGYHIRVPRLNLNKWGTYIFPFDGFAISDDVLSVSGRIKSKNPIPKQEIPFYYDLNLDVSNLTLQMPFFPEPIIKGKSHIHFVNDLFKIETFKGEMSKIKGEGSGQINLKKGKIDLQIQSPLFELAHIKKIFPAIKGWKFQAHSKGKMKVTGKLTNPTVRGTIWAKKAKVYAFQPQNNTIAFRYFNRNLNFTLKKSQLYNGHLLGSGSVKFASRFPQLSADFNGKGIDMQTIFPNLKPYMNGYFELQGKLNGNTKKYAVTASLLSKDVTVLQQRINQMNLRFDVRQSKNIDIHPSTIIINSGENPLHFSGKITDLMDTQITYKGTELLSKDIDPESPSDNRGLISLSGVLSTQLVSNFWKKPQEELQTTVNATFNKYAFFEKRITSGKVYAAYHKKDVRLYALELNNELETVNATGFFSQLKPQQIDLKTKNLDVSSIKLLNRYVPNALNPYWGKLDLNLLRQKKATFPPSYQLNFVSTLTHGGLMGQPFELIHLKGNWDGNKLSFQSKLSSNRSILDSEGTLSADKELDIQFKKGSFVDFDDIRPLLDTYGNFSGSAIFSGKLYGRWPKPNIALNFEIQDPKYNALSFDVIKGDLLFEDNIVKTKSLLFQSEYDEYKLKGHLSLFPIFKPKSEFKIQDLDYNINIDIRNANLTTVADIIDGIYKAARVQFQKDELKKLSKKAATSYYSANPKSSLIEDRAFTNSVVPIYNKRLSENTNLAFYNSILNQQKELENPVGFELGHAVKGALTGHLTLVGKPNQTALIDSKLIMEDAQIYFLKAKNILIESTPLKQGVQFKWMVKNGNLGGRNFDQLSGSSFYDRFGDLNIENVNIIANNRQNEKIVSGKLPLASLWDPLKKKDALNLSINLWKNDLGVLSVFNKYIENITNEGVVTLTLTGSLKDPVLNSKGIILKDAKIYFTDITPFKSPFKIPQSTLHIVSNIIYVPPNTALFWQGKDTQKYNSTQEVENKFLVSGNIKINHLTMIAPSYIDFDLNFDIKKTLFSINFPNIYNGDILLDQVSVIGDYRVPLSSEAKTLLTSQIGTDEETGPTITGNIALSNGKVVFPTLGKRRPKPTFRLALNTTLLKNVSVEGSVFGTGLFATIANNFDLDVKPTQTPFLVNGTLNAPIITDDILLSDGNAFLLNRVFEIVPLEEQSVLYENQTTKLSENILSFVTESIDTSPQKRIIPILNIKAITIVEKEVSVNVGIDTTKKAFEYTGIVFLFNGSIRDLSSLTFEEYKLENANFPNTQIEFLREYDGEQSQEMTELFRAIIPGLDTNVQGDFFVQIGENLINSRLVRPIERNIARNIGLYDLKIDYNVGGAILGNFTSEQAQTDDNLGVDVTTNLLSDRLFLRAKTNLDLSSEDRNSAESFRFTEFELTYFLYHNLSVNYSNVRDIGEIEFRPKWSLNWRNEF